MSERRAHRDPAAAPHRTARRGLASSPVAEADALQQLASSSVALAAGAPASPSWTPTSSRAVSSPASARQ